MGQDYTIGDLSREFQVTTRALRFYEDQGLLQPHREGLNRIYSARDRVHLKMILRGKRLGFSLRETGELLDLYDAPNGELSQLKRFLSKIEEHRRDLRRQRDDVDQVLAEMDALEQQCRRLLEERDARQGAA